MLQETLAYLSYQEGLKITLKILDKTRRHDVQVKSPSYYPRQKSKSQGR